LSKIHKTTLYDWKVHAEEDKKKEKKAKKEEATGWSFLYSVFRWT